jgi:tetratricopeptide (TPR) repeat protein
MMESVGKWRNELRYTVKDFRRKVTIKRLAVLGGIALVAWILWRDWDTVIIDPFGVPKEYQEAGFTSSAVTERVVQTINEEEKAVQTRQRRNKDVFALSTEQDILTEFEVPGTKFNVRAVVTFIRNSLSLKQRHIAGEIVLAKQDQTSGPNDKRKGPGRTIITFRLSGPEVQQSTTTESDIDSPEEAIKELSESILEQLNPVVLASFVGLNEDDPERAVALARALIRDPSKTSGSYSLASPYNLLGLIYGKDGHTEKAKFSFETASQLAPRSPIPISNIGTVEIEKQDYKAAIEHFELAIKLDPHFAPAYANLGVALHLSEPKSEKPIEEFEKAAKLDRKSAAVYLDWGSVLLDLGRPDQAIHKFQKAKDLGLADPKLPYLWGNALEATGQLEQALLKYEEADGLSLPDPDLYRDWDQALLKQVKNGRHLGLRDSALYVKWGDLLMQLHECNGAIDRYTEADKLDPGNAQTLDNLGNAQVECGELEDAKRNLLNSIRIDPTFFVPYYHMGVMLYKQRKYEQATIEFDKALQRNPNYASAHVYRGRILMAEGQCESAIMEFQKAIGSEPQNADAYNYFGVALRNRGSAEEGVVKIERAVELDPGNSEFHYTLGLALEQSGLSGAETELQQSSDLDQRIARQCVEEFRNACSRPKEKMISAKSQAGH